VVITSPAPFFCHNERSTRRRGKDTLCEKPPATSVNDGERMIAAADIRCDRNQKLFEVRSERATTQLPFIGEMNFEAMHPASLLKAFMLF
jgi:hypothetical protein